MKHKGSISQVNIARNLMAERLFREAKRVASWPTNTMRLCEIAANLPVREFYIAEEAALAYIRKRINTGVSPSFVTPYKQRLYDALYERVRELQQQERYADVPLTVVVGAALASSAPCLGVTPRSLYLLITHKKYKKKGKKE